jgi:hypothetical protein
LPALLAIAETLPTILNNHLTMKNISLFLIFLISTASLFGQNSELDSVLKKIKEKDTTEIKKVLDRILTKDSTEVWGEVMTWNYDFVEHNLFDKEFPADLKNMKIGQNRTIKKDDGIYIFSLLGTEDIEEFRASYIYLNGLELSNKQIDSIRPIIIEKFNKGTSFEDLNDEYNMDPNPNKGDLGWFKKGQMMPEFETAIKYHELDDIFIVDIPEKNWYYVTLKTFDNRINKKLSFLTVKSRN